MVDLTYSYSLSNGGGWCKMKVSSPVFSQSILNRFSRNFVNPIFQSFGIDPENLVKKHCLFQKLDHLTCSKCLSMTLHYNMYKPIYFRSGLFSELRYMSNGLTFEILNGISLNFQGCCQMTR